VLRTPTRGVNQFINRLINFVSLNLKEKWYAKKKLNTIIQILVSCISHWSFNSGAKGLIVRSAKGGLFF